MPIEATQVKEKYVNYRIWDAKPGSSPYTPAPHKNNRLQLVLKSNDSDSTRQLGGKFRVLEDSEALPSLGIKEISAKLLVEFAETEENRPIIKEVKVTEEVFDKWFESFGQIKEAQKKENYNADVEMPSAKTVSEVKDWLYKSYELSSELSAPDVVPDAEGGLDIEWSLPERFISVHVNSEKSELNRIFVKTNEKYFSKSLTEDNLDLILTA